MYGFRNQGEFDIPDWVSSDLFLWSWQLRVERPKGAKRRKLYRWIYKEKLKLAEQGIDQDLINVTCRYLSCYDKFSGKRMAELIGGNYPSQLNLDLHTR
jgi:hypothetical protein